MSKRERDEKKDEGGKEKRVKMDWVSEVQETFAILKEAKEKVKKMKTFLKSEYERRVRGKARIEGRTYLHFAAIVGHVEATKVLTQLLSRVLPVRRT